MLERLEVHWGFSLQIQRVDLKKSQAERGIHKPQNDALVISIILANKKVYRVLIDNGSSTNILYVVAFDKIEIGREKLKPIRTPLISFGGECLIPLGSISCQRLFGKPPYQVTKIVNFLVVEHMSIYNVILGGLALNMFRTITLTYHLMIEFPIVGGFVVLRADQEESKRCYTTTLRGKMNKHENLQIMLDPRKEKSE